MKSISHKFQVFNKSDLEKAILKATWNDEFVPPKKKHLKKCQDIFQGKCSIDNYAVLMNYIKQISLRKWVYSAKILLIVQSSINNSTTVDLCDYIHHDQEDLKKLRQDLLKNVVKPAAHQEQFKYLISQFLFYYFKYIMKFARHADVFVNKSNSSNKNDQKQIKENEELNKQESFEKQLENIEIVQKVADIISYLFERILQYLLIPKYAEKHQFLKTITVALFEDLSKQYIRCKGFCEEYVPQIFDYDGMNSIVQRLYQFYCEFIKLSKSIQKFEFVLNMCKPYIPTVLAIDYFIVNAEKNRDIEIFVNNCNKSNNKQNFDNPEYIKNGFSRDNQQGYFVQEQDGDRKQEDYSQQNTKKTPQINDTSNNIQKINKNKNINLKNDIDLNNNTHIKNSQNKLNIQYNNLFDKNNNNQSNSTDDQNQNNQIFNKDGVNNANYNNKMQSDYFVTNQMSHNGKLIENNTQSYKEYGINIQTQNQNKNNPFNNHQTLQDKNKLQIDKNLLKINMHDEYQDYNQDSQGEKQKLSQFNNIINQDKKQSLTSIIAQKSYFNIFDEEKQLSNLQINQENELIKQDGKKQVKKQSYEKNASNKSPSKFQKKCTIEDIVNQNNISSQACSSSSKEKIDEDDLKQKISGSENFLESNQLTFHYEQQVIMNIQNSQPDSSIGSSSCRQIIKKQSKNKITPSRQAIVTQSSINYTQGNDDYNFSLQSIKNKNKLDVEKKSPKKQIFRENNLTNNQDYNNVAFRIADNHNTQQSCEDRPPKTIFDGIQYKQTLNENEELQPENNQLKQNKKNEMEDLNHLYSQSVKSSNRYKKHTFSSQFRQKKNKCLNVAQSPNINDFYQSEEEDDKKISQNKGEQTQLKTIPNQTNNLPQNPQQLEDDFFKCPEIISKEEEQQIQQQNKQKKQQILKQDKKQQSFQQTEQIVKISTQQPELFDDFQIDYNELNKIVQNSDDKKNNEYLNNKINGSYLNIQDDNFNINPYDDFMHEDSKQNRDSKQKNQTKVVNQPNNNTKNQNQQTNKSNQVQEIYYNQYSNTNQLGSFDKQNQDSSNNEKVGINSRSKVNRLSQSRLARQNSRSCSQINEKFLPEARMRQQSINSKEINNQYLLNKQEQILSDETSQLMENQVHKIDQYDFNRQSSHGSYRVDVISPNNEQIQSRSPKLEDSGFSSKKDNLSPLSTSKSVQNMFFVGSNSISQNIKQEWINNNVKKASFSYSTKSEELSQLKKNSYKFKLNQQQQDFQSREIIHTHEDNTTRRKISSYQLTSPREKSLSDKSQINRQIRQQNGVNQPNQSVSILSKQESNTLISDKSYLTQKENTLIQSISPQNQLSLNQIGNFNVDNSNKYKQKQDNFNIHQNESNGDNSDSNLVLKNQDFILEEKSIKNKFESNEKKKNLQELIQLDDDKKIETSNNSNQLQRKCVRRFSRNSSIGNISSHQSWRKIDDPIDYKNQIIQPNNDSQKQIILNQFVNSRKNSLVSLKISEINQPLLTGQQTRSSLNNGYLLTSSSTNRENTTHLRQKSSTALTSDNSKQFNNQMIPQMQDTLNLKKEKEVHKIQENSHNTFKNEQNHIQNNGPSNTDLKITLSPTIQSQNKEKMQIIDEQMNLTGQRKQSLQRRMSIKKNDSSAISSFPISSSEMNLIKNNTTSNKFNDYNFQKLNNIHALQVATSATKTVQYTNYSHNPNGNNFINLKINQGQEQYKSPYKIKNDNYQHLAKDRVITTSSSTNNSKNAIFFNGNSINGKAKNVNGSYSALKRQMNEQEKGERLKTENLNDKSSNEDIRKQLNKLDNDTDSTPPSSQRTIQVPSSFINGRKFSNQSNSSFYKKDPLIIDTNQLFGQKSKIPTSNLFYKQSQPSLNSQQNPYIRNQFSQEDDNQNIQYKQSPLSSEQKDNILNTVTQQNEIYQQQNKRKLNHENGIEKLVQKQKFNIDQQYTLNKLINTQKQQQFTEQFN